MNYLQMCQRVHDIAGYQGTFNSVDATGYQTVITRAVQDAYEDIQRLRDDWDFLQGERTVSVGPSQNVYTLAELFGTDTIDLAHWKYVIYDYRRLQEMTWDLYNLTNFANWSGEPHSWAWRPYDRALMLSPVKENSNITIYYIKELDELTLNTSEPTLPKRHHQCIIYGALMKVATYLGNVTLFDMYAQLYAQELNQLMREANPPKSITKRPIV